MPNSDATSEVAPASPAPNGTKAEPKTPVDLRPSSTAKPTRVLPTTRIAFAKQLELLRAYAVVAGPSQHSVSLKDAAAILKIAHQTVALATPFFFDVGLLRKAEMGKAVPSEAVREFNVANEWEPASASYKLAPVFVESWFWQAIQGRLRHQRTMQEHEVLAAIQLACGASQQHRPQLLQLLAFLNAAGLIEREGTVVRIGSVASNTYQAPAAVSEAVADDTVTDSGNGAGHAPATPSAQRGAGVSTSFAQGPGAQGMLRFNVSVNVDMSEMRDWKPDRIAALFTGIAQVLAAKADVELGANENE